MATDLPAPGMINTRRPGWEDAHAQATELATLLGERGFVTIVHNSKGHRLHPMVEIDAGRHRLAPYRTYVFVAPNIETGVWWFWSAELEPIARVEEVSIAAGRVALAIAAIPYTRVRAL
jgi:hypothetical protein